MTRTSKVIAAVFTLLSSSSLMAGDPPVMKFNDVKEVAPGVFFRYSAISPTDWNIFGGSNNIWIVFEDYVLVYDANFPKEAGDVVEFHLRQLLSGRRVGHECHA